MIDPTYEILPVVETRWARALTSCKIRFNDTDITIMSVHLESFLLENRIVQVRAVADRLQSIQGPILLMGEFWMFG